MNHWQRGLASADRVEHVHAVALGQHHVEDHEVDLT